MRRRGTRVLGPYKVNRRGRDEWRVFRCSATGERRCRSFDRRKEAEAYAAVLRVEISDEATLAGALAKYEVHLRADKENKDAPISTTITRLRTFFGDDGYRLAALTVDELGRLYKRCRTRKKANGKPVAVATHRAELAEAKTFVRWLEGRRVVSAQLVRDLDRVKGQGKRNRGKKQLSLDEVIPWWATGLEMAAGESGAVAALLAFACNLRASEVVKLTARDVNLGGRLVKVEDTKTEAGERYVRVPPEMTPHLLRLCQGKLPAAWVFNSPRSASGRHDRDWVRAWVKRVCQAAGVRVVTAHGMRGLYSTLRKMQGIADEQIAAEMGHAHPRVTRDSYINPEVAAQVEQDNVLSFLRPKEKAPEAATSEALAGGTTV